MLGQKEILEMVKQLLQGPVMLNVAAVALSLIFSFIPGANTWYATKGERYKPLFMLVVISVMAAGMGLLSWYNVLPIVPATTEGIMILLVAWGSALLSCKGTFDYTKTSQPERIKELKAATWEKNHPGLG